MKPTFTELQHATNFQLAGFINDELENKDESDDLFLNALKSIPDGFKLRDDVKPVFFKAAALTLQKFDKDLSKVLFSELLTRLS